MDGDSWAPGERGRAALFATLVLGAVLYPLRQHFRPAGQRVDGFPLSYYPMFSARRRQHANVIYAVSVSTDGTRRSLPWHLLGPGGLNQVRRQLKKVVVEERVGDFAEVLAARVSAKAGFENVARVEIVKGEFDLDECLLRGGLDGTETVLAGADLRRLSDPATEVTELDLSGTTA
jgi:hypothetical protein